MSGVRWVAHVEADLSAPGGVTRALREAHSIARDEAKIANLQARERRRAVVRRWAPWLVFATLLALAFLASFTATAHAQNGLYKPAPVPVVAPAPLILGGLILDRDSIVEMDTTIALQYAPPDAYAGWFQQTLACARRHITRAPLERAPNVPRMADLAFVAVDAPAFRVHGTGPYVGYTAVEHGTILLPKRYIHNEKLASHEMLHAILWAMGRADYGHPQADPIFRACGLLGQ